MLNSLKNWFLYKLIRVLDGHYEKRWNPAPGWWVPNLCEPTVQVALCDLCQPGWTVFDVGANHGRLTTVLSRLVGVQGSVFAFEASPRNMPTLQAEIVRNGCANVRLTHAAICATSNGQVGISHGHHEGADQLTHLGDARQPDAWVSRLALDDFVDHFAVTPQLVKMDIEGAEFEALQGFERTIDRSRPLMIMETEPERPEPLDWMRRKHYRVLDLCNYREILSATEWGGREPTLSNVLCFPEEKVPFGYEAITITHQSTIKPVDFRQWNTNGYLSAKPIHFEAGRYALEVKFQSSQINNSFHCGLRENGKMLLRYHATTDWIRKAYRHWTWHCHDPTELELFFEFIEGCDPGFQIQHIEIFRVEGPTHSKMAKI